MISTEKPTTSVARGSARENWLVARDLLILASIIWIAHYINFRSLGLYEDDYAFIGAQLGWGPHDLLQYLKVVATWPQGRPIQFLLPRLLTVLAGYMDGIRTLYVFAFLIQAANGFLFYCLLRRLGLRGSAFVGAVVFSLYPADTTHTLLMHSLGVHPALTFLLIAAHLYLSDHRWVAYLVSAGSLLSYESAYLPFLAMPLLTATWDRGLRKQIARHTVIWLAILALAAAVRVLLGEGRVEALAQRTDLIQVLGHVALGLGIGPGVSLGLLGIGPTWVIEHWQPAFGIVLILALAVFIWVLGTQVGATDTRTVSPATSMRTRNAIRANDKPAVETGWIVQLLVASLAMLILAYGFSFTHFPPTVQFGRATSVHVASAVGGCLLLACLHALVAARIRGRDARALTTVLVSAYLAILTAYRFAIQVDFREAWQNQKWFWAQVVPLIPDVSDGTMIFVLDHDLPRTRFIYTNSWADPIVLAQLFEFPESWARAPRVFVVPPDWTDSISWDGHAARWEVPAATWPPHSEELPEGNVILLEMEDGHMVRRSGVLTLSGHNQGLKPLPQARSLPFPDGALNQYLLGKR